KGINSSLTCRGRLVIAPQPCHLRRVRGRGDERPTFNIQRPTSKEELCEYGGEGIGAELGGSGKVWKVRGRKDARRRRRRGALDLGRRLGVHRLRRSRRSLRRGR